MSFSFLKSKKFLIILAVCILILAPSSYAGASYYQSNKLIKEAAILEASGDYAGAVSKYDQAQKKWKWNDEKITPKKNIAIKYQDQSLVLQEGEANFGAGEWQKCMDSLNKVEKDFPKYSQAQNCYSDCQKKLDEQTAALAKKAEDDRLAAEAAAKIVADAKIKAAAAAKAKAAADAAAKEASNHVSDAMWTIIRKYCGSWAGGGLCTYCVNNDATCKARTDLITKTTRDTCTNKDWLQYGMDDSYNNLMESRCVECQADPIECIAQYNDGA